MVRIEVLLFDLEADHVRILVAPLDVIHWHGEAPALGMTRRHSSQYVGCKRRYATLSRRVVAEKRNGAKVCFHNWTYLFPLVESAKAPVH